MSITTERYGQSGAEGKIAGVMRNGQTADFVIEKRGIPILAVEAIVYVETNFLLERGEP